MFALACRLEEAQRLLAETPWTIAGIAYLVGFKSAAYFNTFFNRQVGCPPGTYHRQTANKKTRRKRPEFKTHGRITTFIA